MGITIYMVEIKEDDKRIYITMLNRETTNLENIYNKNYLFSLGLDMIDEDEEKSNNKSEDGILDNFTEGSTIKFVIKKTAKERSFLTFTSYLDDIKKSPNLNPLTVFESGIDYISLENITNDLCSCLEFIKLHGMQLIEKKKEQIYVINGRFIILTEDLVLFDEKNAANEENILKILTEICGIEYARDEDHFKPFIYGTFLYNTLKKLIS